MRHSLLFTNDQVEQILNGVTYNKDAHGISFNADAVEGIDTGYLAISNQSILEVKLLPDIAHYNDPLVTNLLKAVWNDEIISVSDYGAILSGKYVYLVPIVMDVEIAKSNFTLSLNVGSIKPLPIKRNLENFLHPLGAMLGKSIQDRIGGPMDNGIILFYYDTSNFVTSTEVKLIYLNFTKVHKPKHEFTIDTFSQEVEYQIKRDIYEGNIPPKYEKRILEFIVKALKQV